MCNLEQKKEKYLSFLKNKKAFTLVELIIVVAIIGIIVAVAMSNTGTAIDDSKKARIKADMETISAAEQKYYADMGAWPGGGGTAVEFSSALCTTLSNTATLSGETKGPWITKCPTTPFKDGKYTINENATSFNVMYSATSPAVTLDLQSFK